MNITRKIYYKNFTIYNYFDFDWNCRKVNHVFSVTDFRPKFSKIFVTDFRPKFHPQKVTNPQIWTTLWVFTRKFIKTLASSQKCLKYPRNHWNQIQRAYIDMQKISICRKRCSLHEKNDIWKKLKKWQNFWGVAGNPLFQENFKILNCIACKNLNRWESLPTYLK